MPTRVRRHARRRPRVHARCRYSHPSRRTPAHRGSRQGPAALTQQPRLAEISRGGVEFAKRDAGSLRDVEQRPRAVRLVQHPQHRELLGSGVRTAHRRGRDRACRAAARPCGERLTNERSCSRTSRIAEAAVSDSSRRSGPMSVEVVRGRVVLGELALERAGQAADREVEPRRVELPLVPSPRNEVEDASAARARRTWAAARSTSASPRRLRLYVSGAGVADAGDDQARP